MSKEVEWGWPRGHIVPVVRHWDSMAQAEQEGGWTEHTKE